MTDTPKSGTPQGDTPGPAADPTPEAAAEAKAQALIKKVEEIGGPPGPEPTRYGDWQFNGKVTDF